jgi:methionyl-tRNA formyltransferase
MTRPAIVIATPHARNDRLEATLRGRLREYSITRVRSREELSIDRLARAEPEYVFFPHWSWIIPEEIHTQFECVIFHMTDLPYGRGGSPLQNLIAHGYTETILTALKCTRELDAGPIYLKRPLSLSGTAEEILQRGAVLIGDMIMEIVETHPQPAPQQGEIVSFKRRREEDGDLCRLESLGQIYDYIRMLDADGYPSAFVENERFRFEFTEAVPATDHVEAKVRIRKRQ